MTRKIIQSPIFQGVDEIIAYTLPTTKWVSNPSNAVVKIYSVADNGTLTDVSSTNLQGNPSINNDVITTPLVKSLTAGQRYRLEIKWEGGGNTWEAYTELRGEI